MLKWKCTYNSSRTDRPADPSWRAGVSRCSVVVGVISFVFKTNALSTHIPYAHIKHLDLQADFHSFESAVSAYMYAIPSVILTLVYKRLNISSKSVAVYAVATVDLQTANTT